MPQFLVTSTSTLFGDISYFFWHLCSFMLLEFDRSVQKLHPQRFIISSNVIRVLCMQISFDQKSKYLTNSSVSGLAAGDWTMQVSVRRLALYSLEVARSGHVRGGLCSQGPHILSCCTRTLFSETGVWEKDYRIETRRRVEEWWRPRIKAQWQKEAAEEVRKPFVFQHVFFFCWGHLGCLVFRGSWIY